MAAVWQYQSHPDFSDGLLVDRARSALILIANKTNTERMELIGDTRPIHRDYFSGLTPADATYFAGHYRGEPFLLLEGYGVRFGNMLERRPRSSER